MAFASRSSSLLRSTLARLYGQQHPSPSPWSSAFLPGARFMSSGPSSKLFVGGLSWGTDENALRDAFSSFGEVIEAKVVMDRDTGRSKGFGFVSFTSTSDAESAMQSMDGRNLGGRILRVNFAIEKPPSARFGGFGGGDEGGFGVGSSGGDSSFGDSSVDSGTSPRSSNEDFSSFGTRKPQNSSFGSNSFSEDKFGRDSFGNNNSNYSSGDDDFNAKDDVEDFAHSR